MFIINTYTNYGCPFYPCHKLETVYCTYCFCPLYKDKDCGGDMAIYENGIKDCSNCLLPHTKAGQEYILKTLQEHINK